MYLSKLKQELKSLASAPIGKKYSRFFKSGKGEYGEGDIFIGIRMGIIRQLAKKYSMLDISKIEKVLSSKIHEHRLTSLLILIDKYQGGNEGLKKQIYSFYLKNTKYINNWDLVDISAPKIIGQYLLDKSQKRKILYKLAKSNNLWEKRIAILSTYTLTKINNLKILLKSLESY